jgi:hypothetical protein
LLETQIGEVFLINKQQIQMGSSLKLISKETFDNSSLMTTIASRVAIVLLF